MPSYTITVTDAQDLALNTQMVGVGTYINAVIESQIVFAQIISKGACSQKYKWC